MFYLILVYQTTTEIQFLEYLSRAGVIVFLILALVGGYREWWIWGRSYRRHIEALHRDKAALEKEKDAWRDLALRASGIAETAISEAFRK